MCSCVCVCHRRAWCSVRASSGWACSSSPSPRWSLTWPTKCESPLRSPRSSSLQYTSDTGNSSRISPISWRNSCPELLFFHSLTSVAFLSYPVNTLFTHIFFHSGCQEQFLKTLQVIFPDVFKVAGIGSSGVLTSDVLSFKIVNVWFTGWRRCASRLWWTRFRSLRLYPKTLEQWCMERGTVTHQLTTHVFPPRFYIRTRLLTWFFAL